MLLVYALTVSLLTVVSFAAGFAWRSFHASRTPLVVASLAVVLAYGGIITSALISSVGCLTCYGPHELRPIDGIMLAAFFLGVPAALIVSALWAGTALAVLMGAPSSGSQQQHD